MTVQELFKSLDREDFIKYYCQYDDVIAGKYETTEKGKEIVANLFDQLLKATPIANKENKKAIIFALPEPGTISLASFVVYEDELFNPQENGFIEHYGYEFTPMLETLSFEVSKACLLYFTDPRQIAASILYEMTFFGYSIEAQEGEASTFLDDINEQVEEITTTLENNEEPKAENLVSFEEVLKNVGWIDPKTEEEKLFEHATSMIEGEFLNKLQDKLYELERLYLS